MKNQPTNTSRGLLVASLFVALSSSPPAQQQATTLLALSQRADVVALATVTANTDPSPALRRVAFRLDRAFKGSVPGHFALIEGAGRCCGRALVGTIPTQQYLLFLQRKGPTLHPLGGERGLVRPDARLLGHIEALLGATTHTAQQDVLVDALDSPDRRIRADAALALQVLPTLTNRGATTSKVMAALRRELPEGSTLVPSLLDVTLRTDPDSAATALTDIYLETKRPDTSKLLRATLCRLPAQRVRDQLLQANVINRQDLEPRLRAAELLQSMPAPDNIRILDLMLAKAERPRLELAITEALLAAKVPATQLRTRVATPVLELAQKRREQRARFRLPSSRIR
ncbi:MAG: hypothetical protein VYE77_07060 [Planctomycetota bacterium]|nr:hypothetical protein [Planctomycetota bacterium]